MGNQKVWSYEWPDYVSERPARARRHLLMAALPGQLALTFEESLLTEFLTLRATPGATLSGIRGLNEAIARAGGDQTGFLAINNLPRSVGPLWNLLRSEPADVANAWAHPLLPFGLMNGAGSNAAAEWFELKLLPPFESVAHYFFLTAAVGESTPDGLLLRWTSPNPGSN